DNDWDDLIPLGTKDCKLNRTENAIFKLFSLGVVTNRDEWVYDFDKTNLEKKVKFFINEYNQNIKDCAILKSAKEIHNFLYKTPKIKYTSELEKNIQNKNSIKFTKNRIYKSLYRPFLNKFTYFDNIITHRKYQQLRVFPNAESANLVICLSGASHSKPFQTFVVNIIPNLDLLEKTQSFPFNIYDQNNEKHENITNFGLKAFQNHYADKNITKKDIFNYCYAVLHSPKYREKYVINLKQDLPRIPYYKNFADLVKIGAKLIDLHVNF
ncbi:MAG: hypothetical protein KAG43_10610, partial [Candidatus Marithrix sp.]|nr:hypothetical protein [Candidatus Marithrix sp.]